jgi:hypothetical protein
MIKAKKILFKRTLSIVQVFRNASMFQKGERSVENGRDWLRWPEKLSSAGYVQDGELFLPERIGGNRDQNRYAQLFLLDDFSEDGDKAVAWKQTPDIFAGPSAQTKLNFLRIKHTPDLMEVHLNGSDCEWWPKRESHKLCELKKDKPVEIRINGKSDGHHQRYYMEEQFIFEHLGEFNSFKLLPPSSKPILKKVPAERKLVDLRVLMW